MCPVPHWLTCVSTCSLAGDAVLECCRSFKRWHLAGGNESLGRALRLNSLAPLPINSLLPEQECNVSSHLPSPAATPSRCCHVLTLLPGLPAVVTPFLWNSKPKKKKTPPSPSSCFCQEILSHWGNRESKKGGRDTFKWDFKEYSNNSLEIKKNQKVRKENRWRGKDGKCMIRWSVWALVFGDWYTCKQPQSTNLSTHVGKENYTTWHNYILSKRSQIAGLKTTERKKWYNWKEKDTNH